MLKQKYSYWNKKFKSELHSSFFTAEEWMGKLEGQTKIISQNKENENVKEEFKEKRTHPNPPIPI